MKIQIYPMVLVSKKSFFKTMIASFVLMNDGSRSSLLEFVHMLSDNQALNDVPGLIQKLSSFIEASNIKENNI